MNNVLVVEDELIIQLDMKFELEGEGFNIFTSDNGKEAIEIIKNNNMDCILLDIKLKGDLTGVDASKIIRKNYDAPIIFSTANADMVELGKNDYLLKKPFNIRNVSSCVKKVIGENHG